MNTPGEAVSFTPGEWAVEYNTHYDRFQLRSLKTGSFGHFCGWSADGVTTEDEDKANAARIVLCVNSHDALLEACKESQHLIKEMERAFDEVPAGVDAWMATARTAIESAIRKATQP